MANIKAQEQDLTVDVLISLFMTLNRGTGCLSLKSNISKKIISVSFNIFGPTFPKQSCKNYKVLTNVRRENVANDMMQMIPCNVEILGEKI